MDLPTDGKLLWVYLFTNSHTSAAGIYKLPLRTMAFETGLSPERCAALTAEFESAGKMTYQNSIIWVYKMRDHQSNSSPKVRQRIASDVASLPDIQVTRDYRKRYGMDTVSIPYPELSTDKIQIRYRSDTDKDTDTSAAAPDVSPSLSPSLATEVAALLNSIGLEPTANRVKRYTDAVAEYGFDTVSAGLTAASDMGKESEWRYVMGCIRNKAQSPNGKAHTGAPNGAGAIDITGSVSPEIVKALR